jgi:hypothetical protein
MVERERPLPVPGTPELGWRAEPNRGAVEQVSFHAVLATGTALIRPPYDGTCRGARLV